MKRRTMDGRPAENKKFPVSDRQFLTATKTSNGFFTSNQCVAVAITDKGIAIRDTKDPSRTTLYYNKMEWEAFIDGVKNGEFDLK